jgi:hypothetical protein
VVLKDFGTGVNGDVFLFRGAEKCGSGVMVVLMSMMLVSDYVKSRS